MTLSNAIEQAQLLVDEIVDSDMKPSTLMRIVRGCGFLVWHMLDQHPDYFTKVDRDYWHPEVRLLRGSRPDLLTNIMWREEQCEND